jgi:hypothetical protein
VSGKIGTEDLLRDELAEIGGQISVPAGLGLRAHERWRRGRRARRFRGALLGGAAMATAGALALTLAAGVPAGSFGPAEQPSAYVTHKVDVALSAASSAGLVQYFTTQLPRGQGPGLVAAPSYAPEWNNSRYTQPIFRQWFYQGQYATTFYGRPGDEIFAGRVVTGRQQVTTTFVTYSGRTWWSQVEPIDPPVSNDWCSGGPAGLIINWTPVVRSLLACRNVVVNNTPGHIDGHHAVELSAWVPHGGTWHLWVNPVTYLPIQYNFTGRGVTPEPVTFHWLRPTRANLAPFYLTVPRGYRQVHSPVG